MDPIAFQLGPLTIRWYGLFFALGFAAAYNMLRFRARGGRVTETQVADMVFIAALAGLAGARAWYVAQFWDEQFRGQGWLAPWRIDQGGLVFYGGFLAAGTALWLFAWRQRLPKGEVADLLAVSLPLAHAFGRIGCFLNGCCYGKLSASPLAWSYSRTSEVFATQVARGLIPPEAAACAPVLPTQLFEAGFNGLLVLLLLALDRRLARRGQLFALYLAGYALGRFLLEWLRGDHRDFIGPFTPAQLLALLLLPAAVALFIWLGKRGELKSASLRSATAAEAS